MFYFLFDNVFFYCILSKMEIGEFEMSEKQVNGLVKWFSSDRGYGYITNNENVDLYFGVKDVIGADLPENGDKVSYTEYIGKESSVAAKNINILERKNPALKQVVCEHCKREVEPKPWYYGGSDYTSVTVELLCPFCGHKIVKTGGGFNNFAKTILSIFIVALGFIIYHLA